MAREPYHTIPVRRATWDRLKSYKLGGASYDEVLNDLLDLVPLNQYAARYVQRQDARAKPPFQGKSS